MKNMTQKLVRKYEIEHDPRLMDPISSESKRYLNLLDESDKKDYQKLLMQMSHGDKILS